jgi:hypothetical protein
MNIINMINPILLLSALPKEDEDEFISNLVKCTVSWTIKDIKIIKEHECSDSVKIYISWKNWNYIVNSDKENWTLCDWWPSFYNEKLPEIWDKADFLIAYEGFYTLSDIKVWDWVYKLSTWTNSKWNFETCVPNSSFIEQNNNYLYYWIIICFLIIIWIVINIFFKNKIK